MYSKDMTWAQWSQMAENQRWAIVIAVDSAKHWYEKWYAFTYGKTDAQVATALGKTEEDVAALRVAFGAFKSVHDLIHGAATQATAYDFAGTWSPF
jgi:hypothetical protein